MGETNDAAEKIAIPTFILQGTEDKLVQRDAARAFFERLGSVPKAFRFMEGWYHELFQEDGRAEVFALIADWLVRLGVA